MWICKTIDVITLVFLCTLVKGLGFLKVMKICSIPSLVYFFLSAPGVV